MFPATTRSGAADTTHQRASWSGCPLFLWSAGVPPALNMPCRTSLRSISPSSCGSPCGGAASRCRRGTSGADRPHRRRKPPRCRALCADVAGRGGHAEEELGDMLFALVKWTVSEGINADDALSRANRKFQRRFTSVERQAQKLGKHLAEMDREEMLQLWEEAKQEERIR